ncbi:hypothetical protein BYT27DRAFT_7253087 [Phlegmacium glaucopus]|nr:hypothetical protein BYT27DRAFT_7253087 [Phlegmacium glaucopus]
MGGAIVTLDVQLVNLAVLPTKFKALTEIVEDCLLFTNGFTSLFWLHYTLCTCSSVIFKLQQPAVDDDIHDMYSSNTLWRTASMWIQLFAPHCYRVQEKSANSKIPSLSPLLGLTAATIPQSLKNLVTRKCGGAHLYSYRIGACRRYLLKETRHEFLYPRILSVNAEGSDDSLEGEDVDLRDDSRTMKTRYMVRESKKKVGGREDAEENQVSI